MFVGEGPGETEDQQGLPFVGRAGELLTQMIEKGLGIPRRSVYICNVVKCRPPNNRTPQADEVAACSPFLDGQIAAVAPRVIVALCKPAASRLLGRDVAITKLRGVWHAYRGIPLMPTFHPAFLLRQYTAENRRLVWEDLKAALARAGKRPREEERREPGPQRNPTAVLRSADPACAQRPLRCPASRRGRAGRSSSSSRSSCSRISSLRRSTCCSGPSGPPARADLAAMLAGGDLGRSRRLFFAR
jgi:uracil-DNA glycosylase family 4